MKYLNERERRYWERYLRSLPHPPASESVEAGMAGNEGLADELLGLYLQGKKSAGSSLLEDYLTAGDPVPAPGRHWIVLDSRGEPGCILRTVKVTRHKFKHVPPEVAIAEGEGDLSLAYWRKAHEEFFRPFLKNWGVQDIEEATVVTEFFQLVFR